MQLDLVLPAAQKLTLTLEAVGTTGARELVRLGDRYDNMRDGAHAVSRSDDSMCDELGISWKAVLRKVGGSTCAVQATRRRADRHGRSRPIVPAETGRLTC